MEKYYKFLILLIGIIYYQIDHSQCQDSTTEVITDNCEVRSYQCKNGACINETLICDGKRDCQDGDDEENCIAVNTNNTFFCAKTDGRCSCEERHEQIGETYLSLNCTNAGIISFPKLVHKDLIVNIFLKGNKIPTLTAGVINGTHRLESLALPGNEINTIENDTFSGLQYFNYPGTERLRYLDLSDNNLTILTPGMFEHLPTLLQFSLAKNQINIIEKYAFKDIDIMGELNLSSNKLEKLTPGIFNGIIELNTSDEWSVFSAVHGGSQFTTLATQVLNLEDNQINEIKEYTFSSIKNLQILNLARNKITILTSGMFKGLNILTNLYLQENEIETIETNAFQPFSMITSLSLYRNKLTNLSPRMFNATQLKISSIDLRENKIDRIESYTFSKIQGLVFLDLSNNNLTYLLSHTFEDLAMLKVLFLSGNKISQIQMSAFDGLYKLEILNLTGNPLHDVDASLFYNTYYQMIVFLDDISICCKAKRMHCYSATGSSDSCGQITSSTESSNKWYIGIWIGILLVIVISILVVIFKFNICKSKEKFTGGTYRVPKDDPY